MNITSSLTAMTCISSTTEILQRAEAGERISPEEALRLFDEADLLQLAHSARIIRFRENPSPVVTFVIDRNINYTNICVSCCKFCAFHRPESSEEAYVLSFEELDRKLDELVECGGTQVLLQGGLHPTLPLSFYEEMLGRIKKRGLHIHGFSPPELVHIARMNKLSVRELLVRFSEAGLDTVPGGGAEILDDEVRSQLSPVKCTTEEWIECIRTAHKLGIRTTATMMFGHIESREHRLRHLLRVRELQDDTGGFTAFICWTFQPFNTRLHSSVLYPAGGSDYLRTLALSRIFLDNIKHIQCSWVTQGGAIAQMALEFGADDMGGTMLEENVVRAAGAEYRMDRNEIERLIRDAGYTPRQRDYYYNLL